MSSASNATLRAYEQWAPDYPPEAHNPLMRAEQRAMLEVWPDVAAQRVLDLACGSGRYSRLLLEAKASQVVGLDFCIPMLRQVAGATRVCASMMRLPFKPVVFDSVICGLAVAHATDIRSWAAEVARVLRPGGRLLYSDFHPEAARAGLKRSFKDHQGVTWTVPHGVYDLACQQDALASAGLSVEVVKEVRIGVELTESFPGSDELYRDRFGLPLVLIIRARK